ncbi:MAG TPA: metalloregulator ArsR/SmtB family transcription factor [Gemmatimonadales bacterium]|nr:metalloregulator ArsR/SmtB family transcription factor [Gemmatimonadales bacterium]
MTVLRALAAPRRREILRVLRYDEASAGVIARALPDVSFGAVSQHLRVLEGAGLVRVRREGRQRFYQMQPETLGALRPWLEAMWDDALYTLKVKAELEEARRGPRPNQRRRSKGRAG